MKLVLALAVLLGASQAGASEASPPKIRGTFIVSGSGWCQPIHFARFYQYLATAKIDSTKGKINYFDSGTNSIGDEGPGQFDHQVWLKGQNSVSFQVTGAHGVTIGSAAAFAEFGLDANNEVSNFTLVRLDPDKICTYQETYTRVSNIVP